MSTKFKLISAGRIELFEERMNDFVAALMKDDIIVDIKFSTAHSGSAVEYSALVHYQQTESWQ